MQFLSMFSKVHFIRSGSKLIFLSSISLSNVISIVLIDLFKGKPLVYKLSEGKYVIDIVRTFESTNKETKDKN